MQWRVECCCFLTLTDPLRIQPWSQDRRDQTKSNQESEISMESRQKRTDKEVASKVHRRDKIEKKRKNGRQKSEIMLQFSGLSLVTPLAEAIKTKYGGNFSAVIPYGGRRFCAFWR